MEESWKNFNRFAGELIFTSEHSLTADCWLGNGPHIMMALMISEGGELSDIFLRLLWGLKLNTNTLAEYNIMK